MNRGVPQGSVLGPSLWNIGFNQVLEAAVPVGVHVVCYADDTLVIEQMEDLDTNTETDGNSRCSHLYEHPAIELGGRR